MNREEDIIVDEGATASDDEKMLKERLLKDKKQSTLGSQVLRDDQQFQTAIEGNDKHSVINYTDGNKKGGAVVTTQGQLNDDDVPIQATRKVDKKTELNKLI